MKIIELTENHTNEIIYRYSDYLVESKSLTLYQNIK